MRSDWLGFTKKCLRVAAVDPAIYSIRPGICMPYTCTWRNVACTYAVLLIFLLCSVHCRTEFLDIYIKYLDNLLIKSCAMIEHASVWTINVEISVTILQHGIVQGFTQAMESLFSRNLVPTLCHVWNDYTSNIW